MAKNWIPSNVKQGRCGLCLGSEPVKRVWTVQSKTFSGDVCDAHMELLVRQQNGAKEPAAEPPMFSRLDGASA